MDKGRQNSPHFLSCERYIPAFPLAIKKNTKSKIKYAQISPPTFLAIT